MEGGKLLAALKEGHVLSVSSAYDDVVHGFLPRSDVSDSDSVVSINVKKAMAEMDAWLTQHA